MDNTLIASCEIAINANPERVWDALTNPEKIKTYLYGTKVITDWEEGSTIEFLGEYDGQQYNDKGNVLENSPRELLKYNYWTGFSGLKDKPENYSTVTYMLEKLDDSHVKFTWHQQGFASEDGKCHTEKGLIAMLDQIKKLVEE